MLRKGISMSIANAMYATLLNVAYINSEICIYFFFKNKNTLQNLVAS
jgi:hypothetical protein